MRLNSKIFSSVTTRSLIFGVIIVFACVAFIFTGFGSLNFSHLGGMSPITAATVGSQEIGMNAFSSQLTNQGISRFPESERKMLELQVLNQMIAQKILVNEAQKIGWGASDSEIAAVIRTLSFFQDPVTKQFSIQIFKNYIASQQISDVDFYNELRSELEFQKMQNLLYMPAVLPNDIVNTQYAINNTEFYLQYALIEPDAAQFQSQLSEKAQKFAADPAHQKQLQALFDAQKNKFQTPAQVKVKSILVSYKTAQRAQGEGTSRTKDDANKLILDLEKKLKSGSDFSKLASATNDDISAKKNRGSLGFIDSTSIDPASFQAVLVLTSKNPLSGVVDTPFGYRLFLYEDSKAAVHKTFDDVKLELARTIVGGQMKMVMKNDIQSQISQALSAQNISKVATIMADNKLSWQYLSKPFKVTDTYISELGTAAQLAKNVFYLKKPGDLLFNLVDFGSNKFAVIKLVSRKDPQAPTEIEQSDLKKKLVTAASSDFAQAVEKDLFESYQKEGKIAINPAIRGY